MVGYAYSMDFSLGYEYILIKAFDCEDLSLVSSSTAYEVYRVNRQTVRVDLVLPKSGIEFRHLKLSHITEILQMITLEEAQSRYPVSLSWAITPSGRCIKKHSEDLYGVWPISPVTFQKDVPYVNITSLCFKSSPSYLEVSFLLDVFSSVAFHCGIYASCLFEVCGNAVFCSVNMAELEYTIFKTKTLYSLFSETVPQRVTKYKIKSKHILSKLGNIQMQHSQYRKDTGEWIVNIKRECIETILHLIYDCIKESKSFSWLVRRIRLAMSRSLDTLKSLGTELISKSSTQAASDIKYLSFDELLCAFTFADSMRDITKNIRTAKKRKSELSKLTPPDCIYKGRFYYKKRPL